MNGLDDRSTTGPGRGDADQGAAAGPATSTAEPATGAPATGGRGGGRS